MLQFSEVRVKMDSLRKKYAAGTINRKQAAAELRKYMQDHQKEDIKDTVEMFKEGWLA